MTEQELREKIRKELYSISETTEKNNTNEAAPRMAKDSSVQSIEEVKIILSRVENGMRAFNQSRYSNLKNDFKKVYKALDGLKLGMFRHSAIPENTEVVNEGPNYDDASFNLDKIFGDDQESIEMFQDIEDNGSVEDMINYIDEFGNEERLAQYGIKSDTHVKKLAKKIMEKNINEASRSWNDIAKLITSAWKSAKIPVAYAKDYAESLERMAKKSAKLFFKQYGDFTEEDFAEDMRYNMANESKVNEKLARGLKPLLKQGSDITKKIGEDALVDLSDKFDDIDDEQAEDVASHLNMAIELMQDGYPGDATKMLKQFNKACKDTLSGKEVASAFEGKLTEAKPKPLISKKDIKDIENSGNIDIAYKKAMALLKSLSEGNVNESKLTEGMSKGVIKKSIKVIDKQIDSETGGDGEALDNETLQALEQEKERLESMLESRIDESVIGIKTERDFKGKDLITALDKAKIKYKMNRLSMTLSVLNLDKKYYEDAKKIVDDLGLSVMMAKESFITEKAKDGTEQLGIDLKAMVHDATSNGMTVKVQSTDKVWDDGVPVLKYIARSSKKSMKLPKKFKVVDDTEYGWWYFEDRGMWYGIDQDNYGTPPFDY